MMIHYIPIPQYQVYDNTLYSLYAGNFFKAERPFRNIGTSGSNPLQMFSSFALLYHRSKHEYREKSFLNIDLIRLF